GFHKAGISFGGYVRLKLDDHSGLQLELFFVQKGSRTSDQDVKAGLNPYLLRLNYVEMPLIYQYDLGKLRLEAGLSAAFLASHYEEVNYLDNTQDVWRSFNFSSIVGVRYLFHEHWSLGLRSINSISSIRKNRVDGNVKRYGNKFGAFNDVLQLAVFYSF
ncbi:MAG TPA: porin family protein, partial [Bacteroidales bacterium]|nr:porin family protein [Bacteroidales bacterium]